MIMILISFLACCASKASVPLVRGYVDVIRGFRSITFRDMRLMASAKHPGVYRTVPGSGDQLNEAFRKHK